MVAKMLKSSLKSGCPGFACGIRLGLKSGCPGFANMSVPCTDISTIDKPLDEKFAQLFTEIREALVENFEEVLNGNRFEKKRFDWQDLK